MKHCKVCLTNGKLIPVWIADPVLCRVHSSEELERIVNEATPEEWQAAIKRVYSS